MNNLDHISDSLKQFVVVKILKFFDVDPGWKNFGSRIRDGKNLDPGWKKFGSGFRNGKNSHPG
jgi:hypothetical protein